MRALTHLVPRRWNSNAWLLAIFLLAGGLIGVDAARRHSTRPPPPPRLDPPKTGPFRETGVLKGTVAPNFALKDAGGKAHRLSDFRGKKTVLAFYCGCMRCATIASVISGYEEKSDAPKPNHVTVWTSSTQVLDKWERKAEYGGTYLLQDAGGPVVRQYAGHPCPRVYILDPNGRVLYSSPDSENGADGDREVAIIARLLDSYMAPPMRPDGHRIERTVPHHIEENE